MHLQMKIHITLQINTTGHHKFPNSCARETQANVAPLCWNPVS